MSRATSFGYSDSLYNTRRNIDLENDYSYSRGRNDPGKPEFSSLNKNLTSTKSPVNQKSPLSPMSAVYSNQSFSSSSSSAFHLNSSFKFGIADFTKTPGTNLTRNKREKINAVELKSRFNSLFGDSIIKQYNESRAAEGLVDLPFVEEMSLKTSFVKATELLFTGGLDGRLHIFNFETVLCSYF
jgi:hypothetical protein